MYGFYSSSLCYSRYLQYGYIGVEANGWCTQAMHKGVVRDMQQQQVKRERQLDFDMQRALEEEYRKVQNVRDGGLGEGQVGVGDKPR